MASTKSVPIIRGLGQRLSAHEMQLSHITQAQFRSVHSKHIESQPKSTIGLYSRNSAGRRLAYTSLYMIHSAATSTGLVLEVVRLE